MNVLRARRPLIACLLVGALVGAGATWLIARSGDDGTTSRLVRGVTLAVNADGTAIGLAEDGRKGASGYSIAGADWQDCSSGICGSTHDGAARPDCLPPMSSGQTLEVLVVTAPVRDAEGRPSYSLSRGVFVRCMSAPTRTR